MIPYDTYDAVAFAQDQTFIRWVRKKSEADKLFWEQWLVEHPDKKAVVEEARRMVLALEFQNNTLDENQKKEMWSAIEAATSVTEEKKESRVFQLIPRPWSYAAAVLVVIAGAALWWSILPGISLKTAKAEQLVHILPGNSEIEINASSKVSYSEKYWDQERKVKLRGEALFDVMKGNPFIVETPLGTVEVLGTRFNVFTRGNQMIVDCFSGRVRVSSGTNQAILTQGERVVFRNGQMSSQTFDIEEVKTWKDGFFEFEDATFDEVFSEMERQFDINIKANNNIRALPYHGFFDSGNLEQAFETVCFTQGLSFEEIRKGVYRIKK